MKLLLTSDWHLDAITGGHDRWPELDAYLHEIERAIEKHNVDVFAFLGDACDPGTSQEARWHAEILGWAYRLTLKLEASIWIAGNHDVLETSNAGQPCTILSPLARLVKEASEDPHGLPSDVLNRIHVIETPRVVRVELPSRNEKLAIVGLPYMARAVASAEPDAYGVAIDVARYLGATAGWPCVVLGHLMLEGMVPGSETEMLRGRDIPLPIGELGELNPLLVANGHYHRREVVRRTYGESKHLDVQIVGAPVHMTFGERDDGARGFLIVEV